MRNLTFLAILVSGCYNAPADVPPVSAAEKAAQDAATKAPTCVAAFSSPSVSGSMFFGSGSLDDCSYSRWDGVLQLRMAKGDFMVGVDLDLTQAVPGNTYTVGVEAVVFTGNYDPCEGTVTWASDRPDWGLSVDAVCHGATGDYVVAGSLHGHEY